MRAWQRVTVIFWVWALSRTRSRRPRTRTLTHRAGMCTRSVTRWQRSLLTTLENATTATVGSPIFIENDWVADAPWTPFESTALFSEKHCTECWPMPATAICAVLAANHCGGAPSSEHEIPATPDGPADAVAVTYWVPVVDGASLGPVSVTAGCWLSTYTVFELAACCAAASSAEISSGSPPWPIPIVLTGMLMGAAEHWCQSEASAFDCAWAIGSPLRDAAKEHTPEGESALSANGQVPRTQPEVCHRPDAEVNDGPIVSATSRLISLVAIQPKFWLLSHSVLPHTNAKPKYLEFRPWRIAHVWFGSMFEVPPPQ